ncbi:hypothetical protein [Streptomyces sp. NPDC001508]|uniref:hypothetical protein n=1 Tax=Streptomyces sp. NPDC001508 TaxID=3154656 RepID=UPI00332503A2
MLFISHDLAVVRQLCDDVAVMKDGQLVEAGPATRVINHPGDPYTQELVRAVLAFGTALLEQGVVR